jgi:hypothetical protein
MSTNVSILVAVRRYAEGSAQIVFHDLLLDIQEGPKLLRDLRKEIGIFSKNAHQRCLSFIEPSEEVRRERSELERKRDLLEEVLQEMHVANGRRPFRCVTPDSMVSLLTYLVHRTHQITLKNRKDAETLTENVDALTQNVKTLAGTIPSWIQY